MELARADALTPNSLRVDTRPSEFTIAADAVLTPPQAARRAGRAAARIVPEETLVPDLRASISPAQSVERRLAVLLQGSAMRVSHVRLASRIGQKR